MKRGESIIMRREVFDVWCQWMRAAGLAPKTVRTREAGISSLCTHANQPDPTQVTTFQIVAWLADSHAAWTRRTYWITARAWCQWMCDMNIRPDNPTEKMARPKVPRSVPRPVPLEIVRAVLSDPPSVRAYAYVALAAYAGLRVHEIAQIRGEDVDLEAGWLHVAGKGGQVAAVPLHPIVVTLAAGSPRHGYWFASGDGHVRPDAVTETVSKALHRVGYQGSAHALRHTFGTEIQRLVRDVRVTQELMRHQSVTSTQIYTEVSDRDMVAAVHALRRPEQMGRTIPPTALPKGA
jgi:integrase/recombinase XerD